MKKGQWIWGLAVVIGLLSSSGCEVQKKVELVTQKIVTPFLKEVELDLPLINGKLPTPDKVPNQWVENSTHFALVKSDKSPVYASSKTDAAPLRYLQQSDRVSVLALYTTSKKNKDETWAFIQSEQEANLLGWVNVTHLLFENAFKKISSWNEGNLSFCKGNYCSKFKIYPNGSFINNWMASGDGIHMKGVEKGHLFETNGIIYAKTGANTTYTHIFVRTDHGLRLENKFRDLRLLQTD